eukprot:NODE_305_length_11349_cov_0.358222.p6 type:complete len:241 gc:universal NODE_305_length_11349_cov_0.358222:3400-4122(+)
MNQSLLQFNASSNVILKFHYSNQVYFAKAFRIQYLSAYSYSACCYFKKTRLGCFYKELGLSKYLPLAVLIDIYKLSNVIDILLKETDNEDFQPESPLELQDRLLNGWKESCYIINGSNNHILSLNKSQKDSLFASLTQGNMEDWIWLSIVFKESENIPMKLFYLENNQVKVILQQFFSKFELADLAVKFRFESAKCCGIEVPFDIKLAELIPLICADGFIHVVLEKKLEEKSSAKTIEEL